MKLRNIIIALTVIFGVISCEQFDLDKQDDPNQAGLNAASPDFYFNSIQLNFGGFVANVSNQTMRATRMVAMTGGEVYENAWSPAGFNNTWNSAYSGLFQDMEAMLPITEEQGMTIHSGAAKVMKAYIMMTLVDLFGDVPFSEALQGLPVPSPVADGSASIYAAALALLDEAIVDLGTAATASPANDLFFDGDPDQWIKVANSMKIRYYMQTRLVNSSASGTQIAAIIASGDYISTAGDDFQLNYGSERNNPASRHPFYDEHYESNNGRYLSNYYMWSMREDKLAVDPRLKFYFYRQDLDPRDENQFTLDCIDFGNAVATGDEIIINRPSHYGANDCFCLATTSSNPIDSDGYWGRDHGDNAGIPPDGEKRTNFGLYPAGGLYDDDQGEGVKNNGTDGAVGQGIGPILLTSFVEFMRAEAALTLGTGEDARLLLEQGITSSIQKVYTFYDGAGGQPGGVDTDIANSEVVSYVAEVLARYDAAASDDERLDIIMKENHIATWGNGLEAYNGYRRTGFPSALQPTRGASSGEFPRSMWYPANYVNLNANATQKMSISEQVFWDTNPAGFIN